MNELDSENKFNNEGNENTELKESTVAEENKEDMQSEELVTEKAAAEAEKEATVIDQPKTSAQKKDDYPKGVLKTLGIVALAAIMAFSGAFFGMVYVCQTAILGDSEFFQSMIAANAGVTVNKVEVDYITGEYPVTDTVALAEKIKSCTVEIRIVEYNEEENEYSEGANGSGVIIDYDQESGYAMIVTNHHVVYGSKRFNVVLHDGKSYSGEILHLDDIGDLAIVRIKTPSPVTAATIADSSKLLVGQPVAAAGNPLGLGLSVSYGYISYPDRDIGDEGGSFIQTDISVNPGNSGGGLYDYAGNLVGIVTAKASGTNVDGIGYAIPSNRMVDSVNDLLKYGYVKGRPALGVTVVNVSATTWDYFNEGELAGMLDEYNYGVYVISAMYYPELILKGDRIVSIDGKKLETKEQLSEEIMKHKAGDYIKVTLERGTKLSDGSFSFREITITIKLRERDWVDENVTE